MSVPVVPSSPRLFRLSSHSVRGPHRGRVEAPGRSGFDTPAPLSKLYHKAPLALMRGELIDPGIGREVAEWEDEEEAEHEELPRLT